MTRIVKIFILLTFISCQDKTTVDKKATQDKYGWEIAKILVDKEEIWVPADQDTCYYSIEIKDTAYSRTHNGQLRIDLKKFTLSKQDRDSVILLVENSIKNHQETDQIVSDYAGQYVTLKLEQYNSSILCKYNSISDWTRISPTLTKLSRLTYGRIQKAN